MRNMNRQTCSGCTACMAVCPKNCIVMQPDKLGFLYPIVDIKKCVNCGLCEEICPDGKSTPCKIEDLPKAYAVIGNDGDFREKSSSGGVFSLLASHILSQGGVVFGAAFDESFHSVHHVAVMSKEGLRKLQGSKYLQSKIENTYAEAKQYLEDGKPVLFSGTPCQTEGLRAFLKKDYDNLYLQDIICHGVPSPAVWDAYLSHFEKKYGAKASDVSFRNKKDSWKHYSICIRFANGKVFSQKASENLYMRTFLKDYDLRSSCYQCSHKGLNRKADITLADFWGIENICPELDDDKGTSLVIVHSEKGKQWLEAIAQNMKIKEVSIEDAVTYNPSMLHAVQKNNKRIQFEEEFSSKEIYKLLNRYCSIFIGKKIFRKIKSFIKKH